jgi:hypothetical protein
MARVSLKLGSVVFDHANYDAEHDVLYLRVGDAEAGEGEATPEGHVIRFAPDSNRIVGLTMLGPRRILQADGRLVVTGPETVETSAEELAEALAAV